MSAGTAAAFVRDTGTDHLPAADLRSAGRAMRRRVPRSAHGDWEPAPGRPDPVAVIEATNEGRLPHLVPMRIGRMAASPFAFLRGAAAIMAMDLAGSLVTGARGVICGDAHIGNVGFYASPEGRLVCDLNDFDEATLGPWEWDVKRCAASLVVAGRGSGFESSVTESAVLGMVAAYREAVRHFAEVPVVELWQGRRDLVSLALEGLPHLRDDLERLVRKAGRNTSERVASRWTTRTATDGRRFVEEPPVLTRVTEAEFDAVVAGLWESVPNLPDDRRELAHRLRVVDVAFRVVGVGSVGTRAYVALLRGPNDESLVMQVKESRPSVLVPHLAEAPPLLHDGERVVRAQRRMQAVSDPLLSWTTIEGRPFIVRQFRNMKGSLDASVLDAGELVDFGRLCGVVIARAHARSIQPALLAGYCGDGDALDRAIARFAHRYADLTEADHAALVEAIRSGRLPAAD